MTKAIRLSAIRLETAAVAPFTHRMTCVSGDWTHVANLELPGIALTIVPRGVHQSILGCQTLWGSVAEPFDHRLSHWAGAVETVCRWLQPQEPMAAHHLLQGVASAMVYFGRQYGLVTLDEEGTVTSIRAQEGHP